MRASDEFAMRYAGLFSTAVQVAERITADEPDAERIAVETLARARLAWRRMHDHAEVWVIRVATEGALRTVRDHPPPRSAGAGGAVTRADVVAGLRDLPRRQQLVLALRYVVDLSDETVADVLGRSVATVALWRRRGVRRLRSRLPATQAGG